jgi:V/A-type H+/Na+-transporting ATPase subunit D
MAATDVNPTRMELIKTKDRIQLAQKGHKLLKQKRDALILEFFKILKKAKDLRGELIRQLQDAYKAAALAGLYHSIYELQNVALERQKELTLDIEVKNVMGVKIPQIEKSLSGPVVAEHLAASAKIDNAVERFEHVLEMVIELAQTETAIKRLILEIEKTKRRVNALEYVLIPQLEETKRGIAFRLDEMERDNFVSLKAIKRRLEQEKAG